MMTRSHRGPRSARIATVVASLLVVAVAAPSRGAEPNQPPVAVDDPGDQCWSLGGFPIPEDPIEPMGLTLTCAPLVNDFDPDGDIMVPELVSDALHGSATIWGDPDGSFNYATYMPDEDFSTPPDLGPVNGVSDWFTYRVTDGQAWSEPATYRVWVAPINDPPSFSPGSSVIEVTTDSGPYAGQWATDIDPGPNEEDQNVSFEVVDLDVTGVPDLFSAPPSIDRAGVLTFTPGPGKYGIAHVTVQAVDDGGLEDWGLSPSALREQPDDTSDDVTFDIIVATHRPLARDDPDLDRVPMCSSTGAFEVVEDTLNPYLLAGACGPLTNDTDPDGDILTGEVIDSAGHGTVDWQTISSNGEPETLVFYMPDPDWSSPLGVGPREAWASDSFTYRATDGKFWSDPATFWIWVKPINDAPTFQYVDEIRVARDTGTYSGQWATDVAAGPYEAEQHVTFEILDIDTTANPTLFAVPPAIDDGGVLTFTPAPNQAGSASVLARATDDGGLEDWSVPHEYLTEPPADTSDPVVFTIVVEENAGPRAVEDVVAVSQNAGPTSVDVLANDNDPDDDDLVVTQVTQGAHGTVAISGGGSAVTYDPAGLYTGPDSFTYTVSDGHGGTDSANVSVTVAPDTTAPTVGSLARSLPAQSIGASTVKVALSWKGSDAGTGVRSYRLERRVGSGSWTKVALSSSSATKVTVTLTIDTAYSFRVRATDRAGNVGSWVSFPTLNAKRIQDTSSLVAYTGTWTRVRSSSLSGGSARYATSSTRRARVSFSGQEVAWIATRRTNGGRARVLVDGSVVTTIDLDAGSTQYRRLVFRRGFAGSARHTLEIRPLGDGRVEIDAFIVLR